MSLKRLAVSVAGDLIGPKKPDNYKQRRKLIRAAKRDSNLRTAEDTPQLALPESIQSSTTSQPDILDSSLPQQDAEPAIPSPNPVAPLSKSATPTPPSQDIESAVISPNPGRLSKSPTPTLPSQDAPSPNPTSTKQELPQPVIPTSNESEIPLVKDLLLLRILLQEFESMDRQNPMSIGKAADIAQHLFHIDGQLRLNVNKLRDFRKAYCDQRSIPPGKAKRLFCPFYGCFDRTGSLDQ
ncbi:MAG: hypothetical protein Q9225_003153 [Loekoesia sp. 1 TL-2023]